jgi:tRNA C32,U32 (ribose-2'-O)-methylase TrmJ
VLRLPIVAGMTAHQAMTAMRKSGVRGGSPPSRAAARMMHPLAGKVGLLLGGEGPGLTDEAIALCDARVTIPALAHRSLNVAAAGRSRLRGAAAATLNNEYWRTLRRRR